MNSIIAPALPLLFVVSAECAPVAQDAMPREADGALGTWLARYGSFTPALPEPVWTDPRPDLVADHDRWQDLLGRAWLRDSADPYGVYGALHGIRCCAARLEHTAGHGWRIVCGAEMAEPEWQRLRQTWLLPHRASITALLAEIGGPGVLASAGQLALA